jgi:hypothetical protein
MREKVVKKCAPYARQDCDMFVMPFQEATLTHYIILSYTMFSTYESLVSLMGAIWHLMGGRWQHMGARCAVWELCVHHTGVVCAV